MGQGMGREGTNSERGAAWACQDQRRGRGGIERGMAGRGGLDTTGQIKAFYDSMLCNVIIRQYYT